MGHLTQRELEVVGNLISIEQSMFEKFDFYATNCSEEHVTKLCRQLADRSRQHLTALIDAIEGAQDAFVQ